MKQRYILVTWPESQQFMDHERFNECLFVQDIDGHTEVGSSAYMIPEDIYFEYTENPLAYYEDLTKE